MLRIICLVYFVYYMYMNEKEIDYHSAPNGAKLWGATQIFVIFMSAGYWILMLKNGQKNFILKERKVTSKNKII